VLADFFSWKFFRVGRVGNVPNNKMQVDLAVPTTEAHIFYLTRKT
jgi:hypothetical protein